MIFLHNGTAHAASDTSGHFDKRVPDAAVFDFTERRYAVFNAVDCKICIICRIAVHCFENTAGCREIARAALFLGIALGFKLDMLGIEPIRELLEREHSVGNSRVIIRLVLFGNARTDENGFRLGIALFDIPAVRLHR